MRTLAFPASSPQRGVGTQPRPCEAIFRQTLPQLLLRLERLAYLWSRPMKNVTTSFLDGFSAAYMAPVASHDERPRHTRALLPPTEPHI
jgi:hypothetical protein